MAFVPLGVIAWARKCGPVTGCVKYILPIEAVNWRKQKELGRSARVWIDRHGRARDAYRFDVVGVLVADHRVRIRHVENAFALHLSA